MRPALGRRDRASVCVLAMALVLVLGRYSIGVNGDSSRVAFGAYRLDHDGRSHFVTVLRPPPSPLY